MKLTTARHNLRRPLLALLLLGLLAAGLCGCSFDGRTTLTNVSQDRLSAGGEEYFNAGPITYQVQISRALNPFDDEDVQYLAGVKDAQTLPGNELWYGVFLWAKNQTRVPQTTTDTFELEDSEGTIYKPVVLNPSVNPYAWTSQTLSQNGTEPGPDSTAAYGPTQGGLVLFKVNNSIYANRPLTLLVFAPFAIIPSRVSLDL